MTRLKMFPLIHFLHLMFTFAMLLFLIKSVICLKVIFMGCLVDHFLAYGHLKYFEKIILDIELRSTVLLGNGGGDLYLNNIIFMFHAKMVFILIYMYYLKLDLVKRSEASLYIYSRNVWKLTGWELFINLHALLIDGKHFYAIIIHPYQERKILRNEEDYVK